MIRPENDRPAEDVPADAAQLEDLTPNRADDDAVRGGAEMLSTDYTGPTVASTSTTYSTLNNIFQKASQSAAEITQNMK